MSTDIGTVTEPSAFRFSVTGNILGLPTPKASLAAGFGTLPVGLTGLVLSISDPLKQPAELQPLRWSHEALTELGKHPTRKVCHIVL
jgi:hypothetical protein